jgi:hypothetical protein
MLGKKIDIRTQRKEFVKKIITNFNLTQNEVTLENANIKKKWR